jgi:hypothetical protein
MSKSRRETLDLVPEISRDRQRLQENLRHDHRAADIQHHTALELRDDRGEGLEIAVAGLAEHRAVGRRDAGA